MGNLQSSPSSSTTTLQEKYDVFLSFRGKDTRDGFTNNLYEALSRKKIETFMDDKLRKGDRISEALLKTIEESKISIVIFSKDYGSSEWCLQELVKIMECNKINKQTVIPVFYGVKPSDVRHQTGRFKKSFVKQEKKFPDEVQKWREALNEASLLSGHNSFATRPDAKLVNAIVDDIYKKLTGDENKSSTSDFEGLIGLDERINRIKSLLCLNKTDIRSIGIWGMGGIGKTTLAETIFKQILGHQFGGVCLILNVKEKIKQNGPECLQNDILFKVLNEKVDPIFIPPIIKKRLNQTRVFIVLDDVDDYSPLKTLARRVGGLGQGSRIIITSRDKNVLLNCEVDDQNIYEVKEFNHHEALQLFYKRAFDQKQQPTEDLRKLSNDIVNYAGGNPLALTVLGSSLRGSSCKKEWESTVNKLGTNVDRKIYDSFKISYDGLDNDDVKGVFLDIACFLKGRDRDYVESILVDCSCWLRVLIDKSLITESHNTIEMHDLLQDFGREIVRKQSPTDPGKRSRLWAPKDVQHTLKNNAGTNAVQGIFLDMYEKKDMHLSLEAFNKMYNLRLLNFYDSKKRDSKLYDRWLLQFYGTRDARIVNKVRFPEGQNDAPPLDNLRSFIWFGYPFAALSSKFNLENLVELNLPCSSNLERLWGDTEHAPKLKWLDLHDCPRLIEVPDLSKSPSLEKIDLSCCSHLTKIQNLSNLALLKVIDLCCCSCLTEIPDLSGSPLLETIDIQDCKNLLDLPLLAPCVSCLNDLNLRSLKSLRSFPSTIACHFEHRESLDLNGCNNLTTFPQVSRNIKRLDLSRTAIYEVPRSVENLIKLSHLNLSECTRLEQISTNICKLKSLKELNLENCSQLESFPEISDEWKGLEILNLSGTAIKELPHSIEHLTNLSKLYLRRCKNFESLPKSMKQLYKLTSLAVDNCNMLQSLTDLPSALIRLSASGCNMLQSLTELPSALKHLSASGCKQLQLILDASKLANLVEVWAEFIFTNCLNLEETVVGNMLKTLKELYEEGNKIGLLTFSCPGSKVPEWFEYRTEGSSIVDGCELKFKMPRDDGSNDRRLLGFVLCAVIAFEKDCCIDKYLFVVYQYTCSDGGEILFVVESTTSDTWIELYFGDGTLTDLNHIAFKFFTMRVPRISKSDFINCSFKLWFPGEKNSNCRIKSVGLCPRYAKHNIN